MFSIISLVNRDRAARWGPVHLKTRAQLDSHARLIRHEEFASYPRYLKDHDGSRVAYVNTDIPAQLILVHDVWFDSTNSTSRHNTRK